MDTLEENSEEMCEQEKNSWMGSTGGRGVNGFHLGKKSYFPTTE